MLVTNIFKRRKTKSKEKPGCQSNMSDKFSCFANKRKDASQLCVPC